MINRVEQKHKSNVAYFANELTLGNRCSQMKYMLNLKCHFANECDQLFILNMAYPLLVLSNISWKPPSWVHSISVSSTMDRALQSEHYEKERHQHSSCLVKLTSDNFIKASIVALIFRVLYFNCGVCPFKVKT